MKSVSRILVSAALAAGLLGAPSAVAPQTTAEAVPPVKPDVTQTQVNLSTTTATPLEVTSDQSFRLIGITWDPTKAAEAGPVEVRVRGQRGPWSEWVTLDLAEDPAEPGTSEARSSRPATEPLWVGEARAVQVRPAEGRGRGTARLELIDPGRGEGDALAVHGPGSAAYAVLPGRPPIITRAAWGADESLRGCTASIASTLKAAVVHHTVGSNDYAASDSAAIVRSIYAFHTQSRGWCDIGYNYLVDRFGTVFEGRYGGVDQNVIGAQVGGFNTYTLGVSMMGSFSDKAPPTQTVESIARLLAWRLGSMYVDPSTTTTLTSGGNSKYSTGTAVTIPRIVGHRDLYLTECPGDAGYTVLPDLRRRVAALIGSGIDDSPIYQRWEESGGSDGYHGLPAVGERVLEDGLVTEFQRGAFFSRSGVGTHPVYGGILAAYRKLGETTSILGWPTTDEYGTNGGRIQNFQNNYRIYWTSTTGAHPVYGAISTAYRKLGETTSILGWPTTDEYDVSGGRAQDFQNGRLVWNRSTREVSVEGEGVQTTASTIERPADGVFRMTGRGYGHGRGLSQWGSYQAAAEGTSWTSILSFYYPGTALVTRETGTVRVRIEADTGTDLIVRPEAGLRIVWTDESGIRRDVTAPTALDCTPRWWRLRAVGSGQTIEYLCTDWRTWKGTSGVRAGTPVTFRPTDGTIDTAVRTGSGFIRKGYRGELEGVTISGSVAVTNVVAVEAYLRSVVANEVPAAWPVNALRSQAVAARSYALRERHDRSGNSFHVYDSTRSQVYPGMVLYDDQWRVVRTYENARTDAAVRDTSGVFLEVDGVPAFTQFSSSNGGWTVRGSYAYLPQKQDDWDRAATANPYREWSDTMSASALESRYPQVGTLRRIRILERDGGGEWGGRITKISIDGSAGSVTVSGDLSIRGALGVRSSYLTFP